MPLCNANRARGSGAVAERPLRTHILPKARQPSVANVLASDMFPKRGFKLICLQGSGPYSPTCSVTLFEVFVAALHTQGSLETFSRVARTQTAPAMVFAVVTLEPQDRLYSLFFLARSSLLDGVRSAQPIFALQW